MNSTVRTICSFSAPTVSRKYISGITHRQPRATQMTRIGLPEPASGAPMPFRARRPMKNHTRLISMPKPEAMKTILYAGMSLVPKIDPASHWVNTGATMAPMLMPM